MLLIACPVCGARGEDEYSYGGDASPRASEAQAGPAAHADYLYLRDNPRGRHVELWLHRYGCQRWLEVERDTVTHAIASVRLAADGEAS